MLKYIKCLLQRSGISSVDHSLRSIQIDLYSAAGRTVLSAVSIGDEVGLTIAYSVLNL